MTNVRKKVFDILENLNIEYDIIEHSAVYTIDEMDKLTIDKKDQVVKNLFVRDDKKKRYFLIVLEKNKRVDLKKIKTELNCRPLSFASEEDLFKYLGLKKGAVTPLGILNDIDYRVDVIFDKDVLAFDYIGVHPNENTGTIFIKPQDLEFIIKNHGNNISYIKI